MSDDDIDNMDFDLPAELVKPINDQGNAMDEQMQELESKMEGMFPGMSKLMPEAKQMFVPKAPSAEALESSKMWFRIYPCYINKMKKRSQGRKISINEAIENPCALYMAKAAELLGFSVVLESEKRHPKDPFTWGRLRIMQNSRYPNKHLILMAICRKMEEAVVSISDDQGLIAEYVKYSLSEISPRAYSHEETVAAIPPAVSSISRPAASSTSHPALSSTSHPALSSSSPSTKPESAKSKKKKEKRKIFENIEI